MPSSAMRIPCPLSASGVSVRQGHVARRAGANDGGCPRSCTVADPCRLRQLRQTIRHAGSMSQLLLRTEWGMRLPRQERVAASPRPRQGRRLQHGKIAAMKMRARRHSRNRRLEVPEIVARRLRRDCREVRKGRRSARSLWAFRPGALAGFKVTFNPHSEYEQAGTGW